MSSPKKTWGKAPCQIAQSYQLGQVNGRTGSKFGCARLRERRQTMATRKTGEPKAQNLVLPTEAETARAVNEDAPLKEVVAQMCQQLHEHQGRITQLEAQHGAVAMFMPRNDIPLNRSEVQAHLDENSASWFEVIEDYNRAGLRMNKGKLFCAQNYPKVPDHVSAGMKIIGACPPV